MTTIKDIATKLGVSSGTVSKGLNGADDISESMRNKILETAVEMGYTKKGIHRPDTRKLCIFIENMDYYLEDDFGYDILLGFKQAAFKESWDVEVIPVSHDFQVKRSYDTFMMGIKSQPDPESNHEDVMFFNFKDFTNNNFAIAEEVSYIDPLLGKNKRPDIVVYVNGIALAVIEL